MQLWKLSRTIFTLAKYMDVSYTMDMAHTLFHKSLFARLMIFFLVVMLIPVSLLGFTYLARGEKTVKNTLSEQGETNIRWAASRLQQVIEKYRHKAYSISMNDDIVRLVATGASHQIPQNTTEIYEQLFSIMEGDTYLATASVVSTSGKVRLSTHLFPQQYDLRYQGNETNPFFDLSRASSETASIITLRHRYVTKNNAFVFLNIFRRIRDENNNVVGYVAVDIHQDAISSIPSELGFSDLLLIDTENYVAYSMVHMDKYGDFSRFSELKTITFPLVPGNTQLDNTIISLAPIPNTQLYLAGITDTAVLKKNIDNYFIIGVLILAFGILLAGILAYFFSRSIVQPIGTLASSMHKVETGNLTTQVAESNITEIGQLQRSFNTMVQQITTLMELTREEEAKLREAERKALEAQMNPHFLYNTLNTVKAIAKLHNEKEILTITTKLGKLLRNAIDNRETETTLRESFSLVESYLTIQRIRFGEKLQVITELDEAIAEVKTPKLIIQPLVENALIHGLEPKIGNWRLSIRAKQIQSNIIITVADNGVGFLPSTPSKFEPTADNHIGLYNIHRRLQLHYGDVAGITIDSALNEGTTVILRIPRSSTNV